MSSENEEPRMPLARIVRYSNGKLRVGRACAFLKRCGNWGYSNPGNRIFAAGPVREEILTALKNAGSKCEYYALGLRHFIVLYPEYITREDLLSSLPASHGNRLIALHAALPFGGKKKRVQIIIDPDQEAALVTSLDHLEEHVL